MKILHISVKRGIYHEDIPKSLRLFNTVKDYGPNFGNFSSSDKIENAISKTFNPDCIFFGTGWADYEKVRPTFHPNINVSHLNIPKVMYLNKEYKYLKKKFNFIKKNKLDYVFTQMPYHREWEKETGVKFRRIPFAADDTIFKDYGLEKKYDVGFTGNLHDTTLYEKEGKDKGLNVGWTYPDLIGPGFDNIRVRLINEISKKSYNKLNKFIPNIIRVGESKKTKEYFGVEYSSIMNQTKIWICTTSAMKSVNPRFFEAMGSKTMVFCNESDSYGGLLTPGVDCITFKSDLSDFKEKLEYYINNDGEREKIVDNAYKNFIDNHTWRNRGEEMMKFIKEI